MLSCTASLHSLAHTPGFDITANWTYGLSECNRMDVCLATSESCYSRGYVLNYKTFSGFSVMCRYCIKECGFKNKCLFICTFAHTVGKQLKSGSKWKNPALSYILFWVAKMNNHILATLKAIPILHVVHT